nr:glycosyltransferase [Tessaracoccus coleopterorum]
MVEALGAGNPVLAHDNAYNRWTAGPDQAFFATADDVADRLDAILGSRRGLAAMSEAARSRYRSGLTWEQVGEQYRELLDRVRGR